MRDSVYANLISKTSFFFLIDRPDRPWGGDILCHRVTNQFARVRAERRREEHRIRWCMCISNNNYTTRFIPLVCQGVLDVLKPLLFCWMSSKFIIISVCSRSLQSSSASVVVVVCACNFYIALHRFHLRGTRFSSSIPALKPNMNALFFLKRFFLLFACGGMLTRFIWPLF